MARTSVGRRLGAVAGLLGAVLSLFVTVAAPSPAVADIKPQVVAQLHLLDLKCLRENDSFGSDEPYININGQRVWARGNVDTGDVELVHLRFDFDEVITVELKEDDGGATGEDDLMATWYIFAAEAGGGIKTVRSQHTYGLYDLRYEVV